VATERTVCRSLTLFQAAKEKNPTLDDSPHARNLGNQSTSPQQSIGYLLKALELHPRENLERGQIHETYARALFDLGRTREAVEELESAFAAGRRTPRLIEQLRNQYRKVKQLDKLLAFDSQLVKLFPHNSMYHNNYGLTLMQAGQWPAAIEQFQSAIRQDSRNAETLNNLGAAYDHLGDIRQAGGCYQQALQCKPDYAEAHFNLGFLLYRMDVIQEAISHLEAAVSLKPDYVNAHFLLAKCYQVVHQHAKAVAAGRTALELARSKKQDRLAADIEKCWRAWPPGRQVTPTVWLPPAGRRGQEPTFPRFHALRGNAPHRTLCVPWGGTSFVVTPYAAMRSDNLVAPPRKIS